MKKKNPKNTFIQAYVKPEKPKKKNLLKPIPELVALPKKSKKWLFEQSWTILKLSCKSLDYSNINLMNECNDSDELAGYNDTGYSFGSGKVGLRDEDLGIASGHRHWLHGKDAQLGFLHNEKKLLKYVENMDKEYYENDKEMWKRNLEFLLPQEGYERVYPYGQTINDFTEEERSKIKEYDKKNEEMARKKLAEGYKPSCIPIVYYGGLTDFMLSEYGLRPGASLGTSWFAFYVVKIKGKFHSIGTLGGVEDDIENVINKNPLATLEEIENVVESGIKTRQEYQKRIYKDENGNELG